MRLFHNKWSLWPSALLISQAHTLPQASSVDLDHPYPAAASGHLFSLDVACQTDDESIHFDFDYADARDEHDCSHSSLLVNGSQFETLPHSDDLLTTVVQPGLVSGRSRFLQLSASVSCDTAPAPSQAEDSERPDSNGGSNIEITIAKILNVNGRPQTDCGFSVSLDRTSGRIIDASPTPRFSGEQHGEPDDKFDQGSQSRASPEAPQPSFEDEIRRLRDLQHDLKQLHRAVADQRLIVHDLTKHKVASAKGELRQCKDIKCLLATLLEKAKGCIHIIILRFGHHQTASSSNMACSGPDCQQRMFDSAAPHLKSCPHSNTTRSQNPRPAEHPYSRIVDSEGRIRLILYGTLTGILSILCLSCFACCVHRCCCNPRVRADRAARREERRTRRQYRCLARQHAWREWWNTRVRRNNAPSSSDYEEKRSLILAQEQVLEDAMQREIQRLQHGHDPGDGGLNAAEQGRASLTGSESSRPPSYRSRSSSGRPPSYHEEDRSALSSNDLRIYTPSVTSSTLTAPDNTPDSSVAEVSPRNSFDTLRTELSAI